MQLICVSIFVYNSDRICRLVLSAIAQIICHLPFHVVNAFIKTKMPYTILVCPQAYRNRLYCHRCPQKPSVIIVLIEYREILVLQQWDR